MPEIATRAKDPLVVGDIAAQDAATPVRWGLIRAQGSGGLGSGAIVAEVFMAKDRSRFRVHEPSGRTEFLSSLQFCKFILELRASGRFQFERGKPSRRAGQAADPAIVVASVFARP